MSVVFISECLVERPLAEDADLMGTTQSAVALPRRRRPHAALFARAVGRFSDSRALRLVASRLPNVRRFPVPCGASACDGARSRLPLRGSSGLSPDSHF